jgi:hypothetical protein
VALLSVPTWCTTSQPQKGTCGQNSTAPVGPSWRHLAVGPIPPADWSTQSTRSHLGKRPEKRRRRKKNACVLAFLSYTRPVLGERPSLGSAVALLASCPPSPPSPEVYLGLLVVQAVTRVPLWRFSF